LPSLDDNERAVAERLSISPDDYRRSKYAADSTKKSLQMRALKVGQLVEGWLRSHDFKAEAKSVWLKTFDGKYRLDVVVNGTEQLLLLSEELMDDILDAGSREAERKFDRVMSANFGVYEVARAS